LVQDGAAGGGQANSVAGQLRGIGEEKRTHSRCGVRPLNLMLDCDWNVNGLVSCLL
jgi:hypothetical protein